MIKTIKTYIPFEIKAKVIMLLLRLKSINKLGFSMNTASEKRVFIFLAADYGNLGDVAITYAQHKFIQKHYPGFLITEIPISKTLEGIVFVKKILKKNDVITTVGGGNMGDLYPIIESYRQFVIQNFKNNSIIAFPQTVDFHDSKALQKAIKVYSSHKNLTLLAREQKTYDFFKDHFSLNKIIMVPDIVLSLDKSSPKKERKGAIICLRDDKEKKLNEEQNNYLNDVIKNNFETVNKRDTHIGGENLSLFSRVKSLHNIWDDFKGAELVVTDRLHGMIFCYITSTPAIVFLNNNHKIVSSFNWIKPVKHIHLIENFSEKEILASIDALKSTSLVIEKADLTPRYAKLNEVLPVKI